MGDCLYLFGTVGSHLVQANTFYQWHLAIKPLQKCSLGLALSRPPNLFRQSPRNPEVMLSVWYKTCHSSERTPQLPLTPAASVSLFSTPTSHSLLSRRLQDGQMQVHYPQASRLRCDRKS